MDITAMALAKAGAFAAIGLAAVGSSLGCGAGGAAAVGAWKKCYAQGKSAPFLLTAFAGAPLSQTISGMVMMSTMNSALTENAANAAYWPLFLIVGVLAGLAMGASAWMQGKAAAGACDAYAETGEGFANYIIALGIIETVAIFSMIFGMSISKIAPVVGA
ncbi:MAG: V-type ATP synthase subunit K [Lentisphaeria bacterium]